MNLLSGSRRSRRFGWETKPEILIANMPWVCFFSISIFHFSLASFAQYQYHIFEINIFISTSFVFLLFGIINEKKLKSSGYTGTEWKKMNVALTHTERRNFKDARERKIHSKN